MSSPLSFTQYTKDHDWAVLPIKNDSCYHSHCFALINPRPTYLFSSTFNTIYLGFKIKVPLNHVVQIKQHNHDIPWKIIKKYLTVNHQDSDVTLYISTPCDVLLRGGETLTHIHIQSGSLDLSGETGKFYRYNP